jgi:hypothetical protein
VKRSLRDILPTTKTKPFLPNMEAKRTSLLPPSVGMDALESPVSNAAGNKQDFTGRVKVEPENAASEARDFLEKMFLPSMQRETSVAACSVRVFGDLVDSICVEVAYECIRLQSIGAFSSKNHIVPPPTKYPAAICPNCNASVGITKYVPHLATCMNIGGRRRVRPSSLTADASREGRVSPSEFDFGSDDDETAFGFRKKKLAQTSKAKNGETKTYGSKAKIRAIPNSYVSESASHIMSDPFEFL